MSKIRTIAEIRRDQRDPDGSKRKAAIKTASMTMGEILEAAKSPRNKRRK